MLEREAELEALEAAISAGSGRVLILEGAAGVGKSALLDVARGMAGDLGHQVLRARGSELMRGVPFGVAVELFAEALRAATPAQRDEELFSGAGGLAASLFSSSAGYRPEMARDSSLPMVHGLYWLLVNLSERTPCLVVVDDAYWADEPSLGFLLYLAERVEGLPVTVLVALRPEEAAIAGRPMDRLRAWPANRILQLEPLSKDGTTALIRGRYFEQADDEFCRAVFDASQGNPFVIQELARTADLDGASPTAASADYVRTLAPESIVRAVGSRISRLPPDAGELAQAVAVLGSDAYLRHAAPLAGLDGPSAVIAADALTAAGVLAPGEPLDFSHPIICTTVYSSISPNRLAALHSQVVQLLCDEDPHPERLALHLMQSPPAGDPDAVERLMTAARRAVSIGAPETAVRYLERALAEPPPLARLAHVLAELGRVGAAVGETDALDHLSRAVELLETEEERATLLLDIGRTLLAQSRHQQASAALRQGLEKLGIASAPLRLEFLTTLLQAGRVFPPGRTPALIAEAEAALPPGDDPEKLMLLAELSYEWLLAGRPCDEVRDAARKALSGTALLDAAGPDGLAYYDAVSTLIWADDHERANAALDVALAGAERHGWVMSIANASHRRSLLRWQQGAVADAAAEAQRAVEAAEQGWTAALPGARAVLALALLEQGDRPGAAELLSLTDSEGPWRNTVTEAFICHARACLCIIDDEPEGAAEHALDAGRIMVEFLGAVTPAIMPWRSTAATALHAAGDRDGALRLVSEELELARAFGAARPIGVALRTMGVVTGGAAGLGHLEEAVGALSGTPWRLESARALADFGAALHRAGRRSDAAAPLNEALELADRCGAVTLAGRVREDLVATGARPRRQPRGSTVLTPAEHRVARLAASGLTNREIAQKLFVGTRAVEFHLGNVYGKFGISSRQELGTALGDETGPRTS